MYTCNVYLVRGDWNRLQDVNTLVDVGRDGSMIQVLEEVSTGVGKKKVDQVVLTHSHSDHAAVLPAVRSRYRPSVKGACPWLEGVDEVIEHGRRLTLGDREFEVLHIPGHSRDSICLFCARDGVLFSGDTPLAIHDDQGDYEDGYLRGLELLAERDVRTVYPGHGPPLQTQVAQMLERSLSKVRQARQRQAGCGSAPAGAMTAAPGSRRGAHG
jgi:glyoxylase-like metal-dependent hydrolase (beta-lactamase superfamily II)